MSNFRIETDSMGEIEVPKSAYWGAQTQRAANNFKVSAIRFPRSFIRALGLVKKAAAEANMELGMLEPEEGMALLAAADEVVAGTHDDQFIVDIFQTGSGTSTNMNANEVLANLATERLGGKRGTRKIHPNDHANLGQSSNDVIPTALHVAAMQELETHLIPALQTLRDSLQLKSRRFQDVVKIGRTHLQDAVPMTLGQEFSGYESQMNHSIDRVRAVRGSLCELAIGGTAIGTGLNCPPRFAEMVIEKLARWTGLPFRAAPNRFEAIAARDAAVEASSALKTVACSLIKIANDIRWLGSGPRCGIGELRLPALQPGSSIMPGKVNPVICESAAMVAAQIIGNDLTITIAGQSGNFELNVMQPVIIHNLLESIQLLANSTRLLAEKCVDGLEADEERCRTFVEQSLALATALAPHIGYDAAAEVAKEAHASNVGVREVVTRKGLLPDEEIQEVLDARRMTVNQNVLE